MNPIQPLPTPNKPQPLHQSFQECTLTLAEFRQFFADNWEQGEHVAITGPTGTGKTTLVADLATIRGWIVVLAVKKYDDTIAEFKKRGFKIIKKWPPEYDQTRVILWKKPGDFAAAMEQRRDIAACLESIYATGGWCVVFDEAGYIAGVLNLSTPLGILLNQGRSSHISVMACMTRPHSMVARVPAETLNQCRHKIIFRYDDEREIKACAEICGISFKRMQALQAELGIYDFLYVGKRTILLVRNS